MLFRSLLTEAQLGGEDGPGAMCANVSTLVPLFSEPADVGEDGLELVATVQGRGLLNLEVKFQHDEDDKK